MQDLQPMPGGNIRFHSSATSIGGGAPDHHHLRGFPVQQQPVKCPRCDSVNTKFCYYNNYNLSQPRHFCKSCRRYWTKGGVLRNVPVGGGCRKPKRSSTTDKRRRPPATASRSSSDNSASTSLTDSSIFHSNPNPSFDPSPMEEGLSQGQAMFPESFTSLMSSSAAAVGNPAMLGFGFSDPVPAQNGVEEEITMGEMTRSGIMMDRTVHVDLPPFQGGSCGGGFNGSDWQGVMDPTVFDPTVYWNQSHWGESDPAFYLPFSPNLPPN